MDDQAPEGSTGALWSERARAALFACPNVVESAIPINSPAVVQRLAGRTDIAVVFRFVSETLGAEEWTPLSVDTVAGPHVRRDVAGRQPLHTALFRCIGFDETAIDRQLFPSHQPHFHALFHDLFEHEKVMAEREGFDYRHYVQVTVKPTVPR